MCALDGIDFEFGIDGTDAAVRIFSACRMPAGHHGIILLVDEQLAVFLGLVGMIEFVLQARYFSRFFITDVDCLTLAVSLDPVSTVFFAVGNGDGVVFRRQQAVCLAAVHGQPVELSFDFRIQRIGYRTCQTVGSPTAAGQH